MPSDSLRGGTPRRPAGCSIREDTLGMIRLALLRFQGACVTVYRLLFAAIVISFVPTLLLYLIRT